MRVNDGSFKKSIDKIQKTDLMKFSQIKQKNCDLTSKTKIQVDKENNLVFIPINGKFLSIHIVCIKNVTKQSDKKFTALRINFQTPASSTGNIDFPLQIHLKRNPIYIKELTFKSIDGESIHLLLKQIKEM